MKKIKVVRQFKHADGIYPVTIIPGLYAIEGNHSIPEQKKVSVACAEIALTEGWAMEIEEAKPAKKKRASKKRRTK